MSMITPNSKWWVLTATSASLAMVFLDQSALPVALPTIARDLHLSPESAQWTLNAYLLTLAVLIILGGKLGDKFGHRNTFLGGMIVFIISSILCGLAPTGEWLIISRALQGIGGAFMVPAASPLFRAIIAPNEFGKMVGLYVSIASIFLILGPTLGGVFTAYLSWRWIFWINFPVAFLAILITIFIIPKNTQKTVHEKGFDWMGFITLSFFLICFVFALMQGPNLGWASPVILSCFFVSLIALIVFIKTEINQTTPFVDFKIFKNSGIAWGLLIIGLIQIAYTSIIFWAMFLQYTLSLSPQKTGVFLLAAQIPVLFSSNIAGRMLDRHGPRLPVSIGTATITLSSLWVAIFAWEHNFLWLLPAFILFGIGSPLVSIGIMSSIVAEVSEEKRGIAAGIASAARQIGGSIGLAVLAAVVINFTRYATTEWLQNAEGALAQLRVDQIDNLLMGISLPTSLHLSATQIQVAQTAAINSYTFAFSSAMFLVTFFSFIGFLMARKLPNASSKKL